LLERGKGSRRVGDVLADVEALFRKRGGVHPIILAFQIRDFQPGNDSGVKSRLSRKRKPTFIRIK
jgi:hypothetical protein